MAVALPGFALAGNVVGLGFEGMQVSSGSPGVYEAARVHEFYNGGFSQSDTTPPVDLVKGPDNFHVRFDDSAVALRSINQGDGTGNFGPRYLDSQSGPQLTNLGLSALGLQDTQFLLNFADGFDTGFAFYYSTEGSFSVTLFDGLDAKGNTLGSQDFSRNAGCTLPSNSFCTWSVGAVSFNQGIAKSVRFTGSPNQALFDNVTFGALAPVPEASTWALMSIGLLGLVVFSRRRAAAS